MSGISRSALRALLAVVILTPAGACAPQKQAAADPFDTQTPMLEVMVHVVQPAANQFWAGAGSVVTADGERQRRPTTAEEWKSLEDGAIATLEAANLLMLPGRVREPEADWARHVGQFRTVAKAAKLAAEAQAGDDVLLDIGGDLFEACEACHEQFTEAEGQPSVAAPRAPATTKP